MQANQLKRALSIVFSMVALFFLTHTAVAQETPAKEHPTEVQPQTEPKQMSWDDYKADLKSKYQKAMDQVSTIEKQASEKKIEVPEFKEYVNRFKQQANEFNIRLKNVDVLPVERQEEFKADMKVQLERLHKAYEDLKSKWATLNK